MEAPAAFQQPPSQTPLGPPSPAESQHGSTHPCSRPKLPLGLHRWYHSYREADPRPHWPRLSRPRVHSVPRMHLCQRAQEPWAQSWALVSL